VEFFSTISRSGGYILYEGYGVKGFLSLFSFSLADDYVAMN
jgi:hypothetical protein